MENEEMEKKCEIQKSIQLHMIHKHSSLFLTFRVLSNATI